MIATLKERLNMWHRQLTARIGGDISTPEARKAANLHYNFVDHGFLRVLWRNFHQIAPQVYRSNQPSAKQLQAIHRRTGLASVLNLRGNSAQSFYLFEAEVCAELGITLIDLPMSATTAPSRKNLETLYKTLQTVQKPVLIHCKSGADRTGLAAVMYLLLIERRPFAEAKRQLGLTYLHIANSAAGIQDHFLRSFEAANQATGIEFLDWMRTEYDPVALTASFSRWRAGDKEMSRG